MYDCSDILSTDTVFDDDDEPVEGDDFNEDQIQFNRTEHHTFSNHHASPDAAFDMQSPISTTADYRHPMNNAISNDNSIKYHHNQLRPNIANGLGFVYPSTSSQQIEENALSSSMGHSSIISNGIPISSRQAIRIAPNTPATTYKSPLASAPSPYSPPIFFSLPSPPQFSQMHQPFYPNQHHILSGGPSSPSQHLINSPNSFNKLSPSGSDHDGFPSNYHYQHHQHEEIRSPILETSREAYLDENEFSHMHLMQDTRFIRNGTPQPLPSRRQFHQFGSHPEHIQRHQSYHYPLNYDDYTNASLLTSHHQSNNGVLPANGSGELSPGSPSSPNSSSSIHCANILSKKERNRLAAERCRKKKQDLIATLSRENKLLHQGNIELTRSNQYLEQRLDYLINILISMDPSKVGLLKDLQPKGRPASKGGNNGGGGLYMDGGASAANIPGSPAFAYNSVGLFNNSDIAGLDGDGNRNFSSPLLTPNIHTQSSISSSGIYSISSHSVSPVDNQVDGIHDIMGSSSSMVMPASLEPN